MHRMVCLIALTGILIEAHPLWAQTESKSTETADGITWTYTVNDDDGGVTLTGADPASDQLTIPDTLGSRPVTAIGYRAFAERTDLTSVTIPEGVTELGTSVFNGCTGLTSVTLPDSLTTLGNYVFKKCSSLQSITLPNKVTTIGQYAFVECAKLQSVTIPDTVTSIENNTFQTCTNLQSITIPDSVTAIGDYAFHGCESLRSITIPGSVTSVGGMAFHGCKNLQSITFSDNVKTLGIFAFQECTSLRQVVLPDALEAIPAGLFSGCKSLTTVVLPASLKTIYVTSRSSTYHPFYDCPITTLIFRSTGVPELKKDTNDYFYISPHNGIICYSQENIESQWSGKMGAKEADYHIRWLNNGAAISGAELLAIINMYPTYPLSIEVNTENWPKDAQPLTEAALRCFSGMHTTWVTGSAMHISYTPYAFGIVGLTINAKGNPVVTAEVTEAKWDGEPKNTITFANGVKIVVEHSIDKGIPTEVGSMTVTKELQVKDKVEIELEGFLDAGGKGYAVGTHRLTVKALPPETPTE